MSNDYVSAVVIIDPRLKDPLSIPGRLSIRKVLGFDTGPETTPACHEAIFEAEVEGLKPLRTVDGGLSSGGRSAISGVVYASNLCFSINF